MATTKISSDTPRADKVTPKMVSLKDARVVVEEGGCANWGQLPDFAHKTDKFGLGFSDADLTAKGRNHNDALHVSIECRGTTLAHVLVDTGSSLNVLRKKALDRLDCEGLVLKPSNIVVRAFDGSKRMVVIGGNRTDYFGMLVRVCVCFRKMSR